jgi:DNA polymerase-3 subunit delta'
VTQDFPGWLDRPWRRLADAHRQNRLPHALLLAGPDGVGKRLLADRLAGLLLCERPDTATGACGHCAACAWLRAGTHPDLSTLAPDEEGRAIKVDQVRALTVELAMTSHAGRYKVAVIAPADAMNVNAANSLLKTLEEPTAGTLLMLLTSSPGRLPATIRSRCQQLHIERPPAAQALDWLQAGGVDAAAGRYCLQIAGGAPLVAARLAGSDDLALRERRLGELASLLEHNTDPLRVAGEWNTAEGQSLGWWHACLQTLIRSRLAGGLPDDPLAVRMLQQIPEAVDCRRLFELSDRIAMAAGSLGSGLNRQLLLEDLFIDWMRLAAKPARQARAAGR